MDFAIFSLIEEAIRNQFGCEAEQIVPLGGGFSGAPIFRFFVKSQLWVVRGWPYSKESQNKIDNWSKVAIYLDRSVAELYPWFERSPIPCPETWSASVVRNSLALHLGDQLWTLTKWVPGEPLQTRDVAYEFVLGYVKQLAGLHRVIREMSYSRDLSPGLIERRELLNDLESNLNEIAFSCSRHPLGGDLAQFVIQCNQRFRIWSSAINRLARRTCDVHWIMRDLWRENLLVDADKRWVYAVDIGASRIDWPAFDFIRLVGSMLAPMSDRGVHGIWQNLFEAYNATNPYSDLPQADDLRTIHDISTAFSIVYWYKKKIELNVDPKLRDSGISRMRELLQTFFVSNV